MPIFISVGCILLLCLIIFFGYITYLFRLKRNNIKNSTSALRPTEENYLWHFPNARSSYESISIGDLYDDTFENIYDDMEELQRISSNSTNRRVSDVDYLSIY